MTSFLSTLYRLNLPQFQIGESFMKDSETKLKTGFKV